MCCADIIRVFLAPDIGIVEYIKIVPVSRVGDLVKPNAVIFYQFNPVIIRIGGDILDRLFPAAISKVDGKIRILDTFETLPVGNSIVVSGDAQSTDIFVTVR